MLKNLMLKTLMRNILKGIFILGLLSASFSLGAYCRVRYAAELNFDNGFLDCIDDLAPLYLEYCNLMKNSDSFLENFLTLKRPFKFDYGDKNFCKALYNLCLSHQNDINLIKQNVDNLAVNTLPTYLPKGKPWIFSTMGMYSMGIGGLAIGAGAALLHYFL